MCSKKKLTQQSLAGLRCVIEVIQTMIMKLCSVETKVAPYDRRLDAPEKSGRKLQKSLEIVSVSAVLSQLWAPVMPQQERAEAVCNAGIKPCNFLLVRLMS